MFAERGDIAIAGQRADALSIKGECELVKRRAGDDRPAAPIVDLEINDAVSFVIRLSARDRALREWNVLQAA